MGKLEEKSSKIERLNEFIVVSNPYDDTAESLNFFLNYYRIINCEETEEKE